MSIEIPVYLRGRVVDYAVVDYERADLASYLWHWSSGYATRAVRRRETCSGSMHRQVCGLERGDPRVVHHINENQLDNRRENLDVCASMSEANSRPHPEAAKAQRTGYAAYRARVFKAASS